MAKHRRQYCPNGKRRFHDAEQAHDALFNARALHNYEAQSGLGSHRNEKRVYACDRCKGYHLTSQAPRIDAVLFLELAA